MTCQCQYCKNPRAVDNRHICQPTDPNPCTPCGKLAELDEKIHETLKAVDAMLKAVEEMEKERQELKVQINSNHDVLSLRMPAEIMAKIFAFSLPTATFHKAPLLLSAVSQRWRHIAHATPQLWTYVPIYCTSSNIDSLPLLAEEWIEKSGHGPLFISISAASGANGMHKLIRVINCYSARWRELRYEGYSGYLSYFSSNLAGASQLQELTLTTSFFNLNRGNFNLGKFILQPKSMILASISPSQIDTTDWTHLTKLTMTGLRAEDCLEVLRRSPNLTAAHFSMADPLIMLVIPESVFTLPHEPILHHNIKQLSLIGYQAGSDIYAHLLCPSLETFGINGLKNKAQMHLMIDFMRKSGCSLLSLMYTFIKLSKDDIALLCQGIPTLHQLVVRLSSKPQAEDHLLSFLAKVSRLGETTEPLYLPDLCQLTLDQEDEMGLALLPSIFRIPGSSMHRNKLKEVEITISSDNESVIRAAEAVIEENQHEFSLLKEQGVDLQIQVGKDRKDVI